MSAVLPLLGGLLLARYLVNRKLAAALEVVLLCVSGTILVASAPSHGSSHGQGLLLAILLIPASAALFALGAVWQNRALGVAR
jgi:drug/metabolite transporter (DMT)-like permease